MKITQDDKRMIRARANKEKKKRKYYFASITPLSNIIVKCDMSTTWFHESMRND